MNLSLSDWYAQRIARHREGKLATNWKPEIKGARSNLEDPASTGFRLHDRAKFLLNFGWESSGSVEGTEKSVELMLRLQSI